MAFIDKFQQIWEPIRDTIIGQQIISDSQTLTIRDDFFNVKPELRNRKAASYYPGLTLTINTPNPSQDVGYRVFEKVQELVAVPAAKGYVEGAGADQFALSVGDTFILDYGLPDTNNVEVVEQETVFFQAADFADISMATPKEIALVLQRELQFKAKVFVLPNPNAGNAENIIRIETLQADSRFTLKVVGGTATPLVDSFPTYQVAGRDAGNDIQFVIPPRYYNCEFSIAHRSTRFDHYNQLQDIVERFFLDPNAVDSKFIEIEGSRFEILEGESIDQHHTDEGIFETVKPFRIRNVPVLVGKRFFQSLDGSDVDDYNGGNFDGSGESPVPIAPAGPVVIEIGVDTL